MKPVWADKRPFATSAKMARLGLYSYSHSPEQPCSSEETERKKTIRLRIEM